jgi:hypothetical protein
MFAKTRVVRPWLTPNTIGLFLLLVCSLVGPAASQGQDRAMSAANKSSPGVSKYSADLAADKNTVPDQGVIPPGTILPIRLQSSISTDKSEPGQLIAGKIAQDVPSPNHSKIRAGSKVEGRIVEVTPAGSASGPRISIQFEKVYSQGKAIPVTTNLRAMAGFMEVMQTGEPDEEGAPPNWWTTTQVGGDSVYGVGGPVMSAEHSSEVVGRSVNGGVLSRVSAKEGTKCRGPVAGNTNPQALWVFSSDACGTYGMEHIEIVHAGRTDPVGTISFVSDRPKLKIPAATAMLLRVNGLSRD